MRIPEKIVAPLLWVAVIALTSFAISLQSPPAPVAATAAWTEFSAKRAFKHIEAIAQWPRPIGSAKHTAARDYILQQLRALGIDAQTQKTIAIDPNLAPIFLAGTVENIVGRSKGTGDGRALLLVAHYDSVPTGPGANDDGAGVATLLETARALGASGKPLTNDVIFLFTDGEETGLLGARAFVAEHPWARDVEVALNFEARGKSGPSMMFETSPDNGGLIRALAKGARFPIGNSLSYEIYKRLPNDTDMTIFKAAGWQGMNFAYIDGVTHYHTQLDDLANVDARSLQHHGSYALALARYFGDSVFEAKREGNATYFNVMGFVLVRYPAWLALPLSIAVLLFFAAIVWIGLRREKLAVTGIISGALLFLGSLLAGPAGVAAAWWIVQRIHPQYALIVDADTYHPGLYVLGFSALTLATTAIILGALRQRISTANLLAGALVWWALLMIAATCWIPGASFLFIWPLLFALAGLGFAFINQSNQPVTKLVVSCLCAIPAILLIAPTVNLIFTALPFALAPAVVLLLVLLSAPLIPLLRSPMLGNRWTFPGLIATLGISFFVVAGLESGFDKDHRQPNHLLYVLNGSTQRAIWASADARPDKWTEQFFGEKAKGRALSEPFPFSRKLYLQADAPIAPWIPPEARVVEDLAANGVRRLRLHLTSLRGAPRISLQIDAPVLRASVGGKTLASKRSADYSEKRWGLLFLAPPDDGIEVVIETASSGPLTVQVMDESYGLPEFADSSYTARSAGMMPAPYFRSDFSLVTRSYKF